MKKKRIGAPVPIRALTKLWKIMRLSVFFLLLFVAQTFATVSYSQQTRLTLKMQDVKVIDVLGKIEDESQFFFLFNQKLVDVERRVDVDVENESVEKILNGIFGNTNVSYVVKDRQIVLTTADLNFSSVQQQQKAVSGKVTDTSGQPLPGVSIVVKGTTNGTISDANGNYSLPNVPENANLQFSFVGMKGQEIAVGGKTSVNVKMEVDAIGIEEVVAIGYGTMRKSDLTGSVVRADLSKLQESPNVSIGQSLQGTVPGLNVGAVTSAGSDPEMTIRGRTSISGSNSPLIVLDGIIYRGTLVDINPNDIESIDILKDASAAAIYGSQASNGVILITSRIISKISKPIIQYSGSISLQESSNKAMKPRDRDGFLQLIADTYLTESRTGVDLMSPNPSWKVTDHMMDNRAIEGYLNGTSFSWYDLMTNEHPFIQSHNLSVSGRSDLSSYFMSMGYTDQKNLMFNDNYKRYNIRINLDTKITDWLKVGTQTFFTLSDYSGISRLGSITLAPITTPYDYDTGELVTYPYYGSLNPLYTIDQDNLDKRYNFFGNFYVDMDIPFIKGLNYRLNFSQNLISDKDFTFNLWGSNLTGSGSKQNSSQYNWTADNILTYKQVFGKHNINSTLVYGVEKREYEITNASGSNFSNGILGYNYLGAADASLQKISSSAWQESSLYAMLRLGYSFINRYSITGTLRRDGFSGFGKNNKFALFPSAAVAWNLSEENFLKDKVNWVDNIKLRLSYGSNGNRTVSRYQTLAQMASRDAYLYGDGAPSEKGLRTITMANDGLKWETTNTFNTGLDYSVFNRRVFGSLEYYISSTYDLLYNINIPIMNNNISTIPSNIGKLANKGFELNITGIPVKTKDFGWEVTFNFSQNRNKVVSILGIDNNGDGKEDDLVSSKIFIGHPVGVAYDFEKIGMWQLEDYNSGIIPEGFTYGTYKVRDINNDGKYSAAFDRTILGYTEPSYRFSIGNVLSYKDWELKIFVNSIQGGKNYYYGQPGSEIEIPDNVYKNNHYYWDYWIPENPNARYRTPGNMEPALFQNNKPFSPYIQRSFVRLQDMTLSYKLPSVVLHKIGINNFKVYLTGNNLLTITDWDGWDPETGVGLTYNSYPLMRSYSMGINFDF